MAENIDNSNATDNGTILSFDQRQKVVKECVDKGLSGLEALRYATKRSEELKSEVQE